MAYTDIRLLKLYNSKAPKPLMSLKTDDIKGAKPHLTIRDLDPDARDKYMNSNLKRVESTSSVKPISTISNVDHYYRQLQMLPNGLSKFDEIVSKYNYEKNQIPQYSFRDHPYIQDGRGLGHSEYEDKYMKPRNKHNSSTVNLETEQDGSQRLFDSQVIDQKQTHRPVEGDVVTQNSKYPDQYASNQPNRQIVQKSGQNNDKQFDDLPQYNREDINTGHNDRQAKAQANPYDLTYDTKASISKQSIVRDSLDDLHQNMSLHEGKSRSGKYQRRPEREEFDENYSHHQQVLEKRIAKFTKSKESADSPFNNPPNYGNKSMSRYQLTERVAKGEHPGTIQDQSKEQSHEKDTYTNRYQNNGDTRRTIENKYGNGTSQRSNYKHEQVQTSPMNGSQYQVSLSSGQDIQQNAQHGTSSYNPYSDSQAYPNTERGYQAKQDNNRSEFPNN